MRVLVVPDLHAPYSFPRAGHFLRQVKRLYRTNTVVCLGDEIDAHCWSKWGKSTAAKGAADELHAARNTLQGIFNGLADELLICNSNHVDRAAKRVEEAGIPSDFLRPIGEVLGAPMGWKWADWWEVDGVMYQHGDGYGGAQAAKNAALDNRQSTVIGHLHCNAGVWWTASRKSAIWGMSAGCLIDPAAPVYGYGKHHRIKPLIGCGVVLDGVPTWIPV